MAKALRCGEPKAHEWASTSSTSSSASKARQAGSRRIFDENGFSSMPMTLARWQHFSQKSARSARRFPIHVLGLRRSKPRGTAADRTGATVFATEKLVQGGAKLMADARRSAMIQHSHSATRVPSRPIQRDSLISMGGPT
eukprot:4258083-Lingulodinium_polyedra.AAC.1